MNLRLLWVIGLFVPAAAALAGDDGSLEPAADPPQGWFARVREKAQVVDAAVDAVETSLGAGGAQAPPVEKANQLVAAWNELMDTTEEAIRHFENGPLLRDVLMKWSIDFREGPDQPLFRLPTSGPLVVESARILAVNTVRQRQLAREAEGWRGLRQIDAAGFTLSTPFVRGYAPPPCANGSRPPTPDDSWTAGCEFVFRIGPMQEGKPPVAVARGVAGPVTGVELRLTIDQDVERVAGPPVDRLPFPTQKLKKGIGRPPALVNPALRPILPFGEGMTRPERISGENPVYTREALLAHVQGLMIVKCIVRAEGTLSNCRIIKPLPFMERAILDALATRRYKPVTYAGEPVDCDYVFNIKLVMPTAAAPGPPALPPFTPIQ